MTYTIYVYVSCIYTEHFQFTFIRLIKQQMLTGVLILIQCFLNAIDRQMIGENGININHNTAQ